jgi:hypothetical protein
MAAALIYIALLLLLFAWLWRLTKRSKMPIDSAFTGPSDAASQLAHRDESQCSNSDESESQNE